ncbi:MAG: Gfo/Idh/MocA family protein [Bryobacteraceae bacterium]
MPTRRSLLKFAAGWTAGSYARIMGANRRVRLGLIGCGGRGSYVAGFMRELPDVEFVALCDVWLRQAEKARGWAGAGATAVQDFRPVLERNDIDAVVVSTPDHWHAAVTILACQAGKHVYVEKPLAHNIREGRAMVEAARRSGRIVQVGTQHRSAPHLAEAAGIIRSGELGPVHFVRVWNYANLSPEGIGHAPDGSAPGDMDWALYLGAAPEHAYNRLRHGPTFRWFHDYSGGIITDYGTHRFDTVHQIMNAAAPAAVSASGGRYVLRDDGDVPDLIQATYEYPGFVMSYEACLYSAHGLGGRTPELRYYNARGEFDRPNGMAFYGANGALFVDRLMWEIYPDFKPAPWLARPGELSTETRIARRTRQGADATRAHAQAFIAVLRDGRECPCDVATGHRSTTVAHLGNIALATGRKLKWDAQREEFPGDAEANRLLGRAWRGPWADLFKS